MNERQIDRWRITPLITNTHTVPTHTYAHSSTYTCRYTFPQSGSGQPYIVRECTIIINNYINNDKAKILFQQKLRKKY